MANLVTLASTTLNRPVSASDTVLLLASRDGVLVGKRLVADGESMIVRDVSLPSTFVTVSRGADGTGGVAHANGATVWVAEGYQLYDRDPFGLAPTEVLVSPWLNIKDWGVFFAQGDAAGPGNQARWWQKQEPTYGQGALGVRTVTLDPTAGT
jgi:hypothetical protein